MNTLQWIDEAIAKRESALRDASKRIWEYAELSYEELRSVQVLQRLLREEGFEIQTNIAGIPTAFTASYGEGGVSCGFLGEFDALEGLSQDAELSVQAPVVEGGCGHGCGHNLLGVGSAGAAIAVKEYIRENHIPARVVYFGCPAEEGAGSKQFMARSGAFDGLDFIYTWHPGTENAVQSARTVAIMGACFSFFGKSSHAGSAPHLGRSALDAVELMNIGVNYLREHMIPEARIHYAYQDAGGSAPNVIPDRAVIKYEVRAPKVAQMQALFERVSNVAKGAALMTETKVEQQITMAFSDYIPNDALAEIAQAALIEAGAPGWDIEDQELARRFIASYDAETYAQMKEAIEQCRGAEAAAELLEVGLDGGILPYKSTPPVYQSGSTDVGDVAYCVPTINFNIVTAAIGTVGHTWQMTAQSGNRIGEKGMLHAAKVMALAALRTIESPDQIEQAKRWLAQQNPNGYQCPLPDTVEPPIGIY